MKRIFSLIIFLFSFLFLNAQEICYFEDIDSHISEQTSFFEGFYSINQDSDFIGTVYAITYFDPETNEIALCLPTNSEMPTFCVYKFKVSDKDVNDAFDGSLVIKSKEIFYNIDGDGEYFYITLKWKTHNIIYEGMFEIEEDLD